MLTRPWERKAPSATRTGAQHLHRFQFARDSMVESLSPAGGTGTGNGTGYAYSNGGGGGGGSPSATSFLGASAWSSPDLSRPFGWSPERCAVASAVPSPPRISLGNLVPRLSPVVPRRSRNGRISRNGNGPLRRSKF